MNKNRVFPFERNRYYAGKMLTSIDFKTEQVYMNNKRRFLNQTIFGSGVICGLTVLNLDELSILIESGAAIDGLGREIAVEKTIVCKLSSIEGFERLTGNKAALYLRYKEEDVHPVYSIEHQEDGREYEYNRIREGYELFLSDAVDQQITMDAGFLLEDILLAHKDYCVKVCVPSIACKGKAIKFKVVVEKLSASLAPLALNAVFQLPVFTTQENMHELEVSLHEIILEQGTILEQEYWLNTECAEVEETNILLKKGSMHAMIGGWESEAAKEMNLKIAITAMQPEEVVIAETGKPSLELRGGQQLQDAVCLAEFTLMRTEAAYLIEAIRESGVKKYITTPAEAYNRTKYASYYRDIGIKDTIGNYHNSIPGGGPNQASNGGTASWAADMASGFLEIPLSMNMRKGDICYSQEVMHGLGCGNVYVEAGIEYPGEDMHSGKKVKNTIYGDSNLFDDQEHMGIQTAVKVCNDRGCFQVAAKLMGEQRSIVLQVNWVAIKFQSEEESHMAEDHTGMNIIPDTPTARMAVKESHCFLVHFQNMQPCRVTYQLTENGSGEISADGIYTAPTACGVYEIYIYCTDRPEIFTYAYAIVNK